MEPSFDKNETNQLIKYMRGGGWVTEFKKTQEFSEMVRDYTKSKFCSIVSNGTVSLYIALMACGVRKGDEVIVPDYTMIASPNAIVLVGAKPVFCDIEQDTLCLDFDLFKKLITPKTKAVMLVTVNGRYPTKYMDIVKFCKENKIFLIEDAAQSFGSFYEKKHLGTFGDIGSYSFSAPKIITTGQGGALVTDNPELYEKIKKIRDFGRENPGNDHYLTLGWNFKFTDLQAVIGIEQLKKMRFRVKRKKEIYKLYTKLLRNNNMIELIPTNLKDTSPWFNDILVEKRDELIEFLKMNNIGTREFYPALHSTPVYNIRRKFPVTDLVARKGLWLPSSVKLTDEDITYVCSKINEFYE